MWPTASKHEGPRFPLLAPRSAPLFLGKKVTILWIREFQPHLQKQQGSHVRLRYRNRYGRPVRAPDNAAAGSCSWRYVTARTTVEIGPRSYVFKQNARLAPSVLTTL
ncbi:hypothetical protein MRX96_007507 [Rhipicephalus microplus]